MLRAQSEIGNKAVADLLSPRAPSLQRDEPGTAVGQPPEIDKGVEAEMAADAASIRSLLDQSWVAPPDETEALSRVRKWSSRDEQYKATTGYTGSAYLDRFISVLKQKVFSVNTIRTGWVDEWTNGYDLLFHELEDDRLAELRRLMTRSSRGSAQAETPRAESIWSFVGKREAMGGLGMVKGLSTTLAGVVDLATWVTGGDLSKGGLADEVGKGWDELVGMAAKGMGLDEHEKTVGDFSAFDVGNIGGKVIGGLATAGTLAEAGLAGQAVAAVQTAKSFDDLIVAVKKLREGPPPQSWGQIAQRPDVWAKVVGVVAGAVGVRGGLSAAGSATNVACAQLGMALSAGQVALLVGAYRAIDEDPTIPASMRTQRKADVLAEALTSGLTAVDARYGHEFKARWAANVDPSAAAAPSSDVPAGRETAPAASDVVPTTETGPIDVAGGLTTSATEGGATPSRDPNGASSQNTGEASEFANAKTPVADKGGDLAPADATAQLPARETDVDLTDARARRHILDGDETGGGHGPGRGMPGKSEFPSTWSDAKVLHEISDVATDPASTRIPQGGRTVVTGTRDGIVIRVIVQNSSGRIVTGYPTNVPRNP